MSGSANFAATPNGFVATIPVTAINKRDNSGNANSALLMDAGANGSRVDTINFNAQAGAGDVTGTTAAMLYLYIGASAATAKLTKQVQITAVTPTNAAPSWSQQLTNLAMVLKTGQHLYGAFSVSPGVPVDVTGILAGDL